MNTRPKTRRKYFTATRTRKRITVEKSCLQWYYMFIIILYVSLYYFMHVACWTIKLTLPVFFSFSRFFFYASFGPRHVVPFLPPVRTRLDALLAGGSRWSRGHGVDVMTWPRFVGCQDEETSNNIYVIWIMCTSKYIKKKYETWTFEPNNPTFCSQCRFKCLDAGMFWKMMASWRLSSLVSWSLWVSASLGFSPA